MNSITTTAGTTIHLDGDLLAILEALYQEVVVRSELAHTYEDMVREINHLVAQMNEDQRRSYLVESLFLNSVRYENEKLAAWMHRLASPNT
jgi:hypothetical protein